MRKTAIALIVALAMTTAAAAQNAVIDAKGSLGLQFDLDGFYVDGVVVDFPGRSAGAAIGGKYYIADGLGLGIGLYLGGSSDSVKGYSVFRFALRPELSYTLFKSGQVAFYTGGYLGLGIRKTSFDSGSSLNEDCFSAGARLGAEYALLPKLSLAAEYAFGVSADDDYVDWGGGVTRFYLTFYR